MLLLIGLLQKLPSGKLLRLGNNKLAIECCCKPEEPGACDCYLMGNPIANFTWTQTDDEPCCFKFTDTSTSSPCGAINSWVWDFGDGFFSFQRNPTHCYTGIGPWEVKLTVGIGPNTVNCTAEKIQTITCGVFGSCCFDQNGNPGVMPRTVQVSIRGIENLLCDQCLQINGSYTCHLTAEKSCNYVSDEFTLAPCGGTPPFGPAYYAISANIRSPRVILTCTVPGTPGGQTQHFVWLGSNPGLRCSGIWVCEWDHFGAFGNWCGIESPRPPAIISA